MKFQVLILSQLPIPKEVGLLLSSSMPVSMISSERNDWLVDFPCEGQRAIDYFTPRQPDMDGGLDAFVPFPHGKQAIHADMFLRTVHLNRLSPHGSVFPFHGMDTAIFFLLLLIFHCLARNDKKNFLCGGC